MAGHSPWANIKHRKAAVDAKRGKLWTKLSKAIIVAAKMGGGDPETNLRLRYAINDAKAVSMPKDNIERAIKRGTGEAEGAHYDEIWYEGYAPGGVAVFVQALTDNRNRAASDIRSTFSRNGGNLGEPGSVGYLFVQKGYALVSGDEDEVLMAALDAGAEDVRPGAGQHEVISAPGDLAAVVAALEAAGLAVDDAEVTQMPATTIPLDEAGARAVLRLIDALEDLDDVQAVYANFDISDDVMAVVAG